MSEITYTTILHKERQALGLTPIEYSLCDSIYKLSSNMRSKYPGWCNASKKYLGEFIGISERQVFRIVKKLFMLELLEKCTDIRINKSKSDLIRTTMKWYRIVVCKQ